MNNDITGIVRAYTKLKYAGHDMVLATVIETKGSTYRRAGARMLITRQKESYGLLGGGCFEDDLFEEAKTVFETGKAKVVLYDMRGPEDAVWGLGLGCNGAVRILLEKLSPDDSAQPLEKIAHALSASELSLIATVVDSAHPSLARGMTWELIAGKLQRETLPSNLAEGINEVARSVLESGSAMLHTHVVDDANVEVFYAPIKPPNHLVVLGAGADAVPVVQIAKKLGWKVTVVDDRASHAQARRFPDADQVLVLVPDRLLEEVEGDTITAALIMSHNFDKDEAYLKQLALTNARYIGLLGPRERGEKLLASTRESIESVRDCVFGPVGLDIGAELPEEIALSALAEIQAVLSDRNGLQLSKKRGPIHARQKG